MKSAAAWVYYAGLRSALFCQNDHLRLMARCQLPVNGPSLETTLIDCYDFNVNCTGCVQATLGVCGNQGNPIDRISFALMMAAAISSVVTRLLMA